MNDLKEYDYQWISIVSAEIMINVRQRRRRQQL